MIVFFAFSWTSTSDQNHHFLDENYSPDLTVEQIPNTFQQEKPKPVIPKLIVELPEELIDEEPEEYFEPMDISVDQSVFDEGIRAEESNHTPPPLPPPVENDYDESPFYVVEVNPRFPGCEIKTLSNKIPLAEKTP